MGNIKVQSKNNLNNLDDYILELKEFTGININSELLSSTKDMEEIRQKSMILKNKPEKTFSISFEEKSSLKFKDFVRKLYILNDSPVYIWTKKSNIHGLYKAKSINSLNYSFTFDVNVEGIVVFLTENLEDKIILDYYKDNYGKKLLDITLKGQQWSSISY